MSRFSRLDVYNTILGSGLVAVFNSADIQVAQQVVKACDEGGLRVFEFTNRGEHAVEIFRELSQYCLKELPRMILGVGTIVDEPTAALYVALGAHFVVGPILNEAVARFCNRRKIAYLPGCGSVSEISRAEELGVEIVKAFPADSLGGPEFVKAILGPCPWSKIMPTGGVEPTQESMQAWFKAGVVAVGIGTKLLRQDLIDRADYDTLASKTSELLNWIKQARGESLFEGVEHVGLYPFGGATGKEMVRWYQRTFGFKVAEGAASFFAEGWGPGRLEIGKEGGTDRCHIAIRVSNIESAVAALQVKGVELEPIQVMPAAKAVFLKQSDPAGNRVHLLWRR